MTMRTKTLLIGVLAVACLLVARTGTANAELTRDGEFVFLPYTQNNDPVNLLLSGGQGRVPTECYNFNQNRADRSLTCWRHINDTAWRRKSTRLQSRRCNGRDTLQFAPEPGQRVPVRNQRSDSTSTTCRTQYHVRQWNDAAINESPLDAGEWSVGTVYHETRCGLPAPWVGGNCYGKGSHRIDQDWETAENTVWYHLTKSTDGETSYCVFPDWRAFPNQTPGKHRGWYSNGRITRISVSMIDASDPPSSRCEGA